MAQTLASVAPLILPADPSGRCVEGYITLSQAPEQQPAHLWLRLSNIPCAGPTLAGAKLEVNPALATLLNGLEELVAARLKESASLAAFLVELRNLLDQAHFARSRAGAAGTATGAAAAPRPASFFQALKSQLDILGWSPITHLSDDLSAFTLALRDRRGRAHSAKVTLPPSYPSGPPLVSADLPAAFTPSWRPGATTLPQLASQLEAALEGYQWLWDSLDDVDSGAWVIEPLNPPRAATMRRLALGNHVSLAVVLDPERPGAFPECRFMGPDAAVAPLRQRLHQNRGRWREDRLLRENLQDVLEQVLPSKEAAAADGGLAEDVSAECAICYAYRLPPPPGEEGQQPQQEGEDEGAVPDINCSNPSCGKPFHWQCLVEWLNADTSTRQSFGTLFGTCPYCSDPITVRVL